MTHGNSLTGQCQHVRTFASLIVQNGLCAEQHKEWCQIQHGKESIFGIEAEAARAAKLTINLRFCIDVKNVWNCASTPHTPSPAPIGFHDMVRSDTNRPAFFFPIMFNLTTHECTCVQDGALQRVYDTMVHRGKRGKLHSFVTSALNGVE